MRTNLDVLELMPADTPDYMAQAWIDCLMWALGEPEIVAAFCAATGNQWTPARHPLEMMIDAATGADAEFIRAFILWANVEVWGPMDGPEPPQ
jgi:hypothetical protein